MNFRPLLSLEVSALWVVNIKKFSTVFPCSTRRSLLSFKKQAFSDLIKKMCCFGLPPAVVKEKGRRGRCLRGWNINIKRLIKTICFNGDSQTRAYNRTRLCVLEDNLFWLDSLPHSFLMLAFQRHITIFGGAIRSRKGVERDRRR